MFPSVPGWMTAVGIQIVPKTNAVWGTQTTFFQDRLSNLVLDTVQYGSKFKVGFGRSQRIEPGRDSRVTITPR